MNQIWEGIKPLMDSLGAEPWMYGVLAAFGVAHQYACAYFERWTRKTSFLSAVAVSVVFGGISFWEHHLSPLEGATRILALLAGALLAEAGVNRLAGIVPWIPKYNQNINQGG